MESFIPMVTLLMLTIVHVQCCNVRTSATEVIADCSGLNLQTLPGSNQIPNTTTKLLLDNNNISGTINTTVFKHLTHLTYLDLSNNFIQRMFAFEGLYFLKYLDLQNNYLCLDQKSFPSLSSLVSLRVFKLERHRGGYCHSREILNGTLFSDMKHLEELRINGLQTTFGHGFQTLRKLRILRVTGSDYYFNASVTDDTFKVFKNGNISEIYLQSNNIETLSPKAFSYFPYLQTLVIVCSHYLGLSPVLAAVQHLNTKVLHTLVLDGIGGITSSSPLGVVTYSNFCSQSTLSIKRLTLRGNRILKIDASLLNSTCLPKLEYIALGYNTIVLFLNVKLIPAMNITNLRTIDASYYGVLNNPIFEEQYCRHVKEIDDYFLKEPNLPKLLAKDIIKPKGKFALLLPQSVQFIHAQHVAVAIGCPEGGMSIIDLSNNIRFLNISYIPTSTIKCSFPCFPTLQFIDATNMELSLLPDTLFKCVPNIMYLNLKNNFLGKFNNSLSFTKYTAKLRSLDISNNGYKTIHVNDLKWLQNLESLILADNKLENIYVNASHMNRLNYLDISGNKLTSLDNNTQDELDKIARQQHITINLSDNPFICGCDTRSFVKWIQVTSTPLLDKDNYKCRFKQKIVQIISVDSATLETVCSPKTFHIYMMPLVISIPALLIVMGIIGGVLYYFRWILRWKFYKLQKIVSCKRYGRRLMDDQDLDNIEHKYNAFIMANLEDYHWIKNLLQPKIEDEWEMHLCLEYRDFVGGAPITECVVEAIERTDKTILVLTNAFLHGKYCEFAMQMALTKGQDTLILCVMEELNLGQLSKTLRWLLRSDTTHCLEWTDNENGQQLFWNKLEDALQH